MHLSTVSQTAEVLTVRSILLRLIFSRSLNSIPAQVPEVKINNQSENFTSLYPTAATEKCSFFDKMSESRASSESVKSQICTSHKRFRASKNKMVGRIKV